jgi:hypothetical protein
MGLMCTAVAYDGAMGFADGGATAFEARQEAARRKAAETASAPSTTPIPPVSSESLGLDAFDQRIAEARREAQEAEGRRLNELEWKTAQEEEARARMARLSKDFSMRADALGFPSDHTFIAAREQKQGSIYAYTFIEVVAEGWLVSDHYGHEYDYDRHPTMFYVTRDGPWLPISGTRTITGRGEGVPPQAEGQSVVAYAAERASIRYVTSNDIRGKDLEGLLATELVRLERQSKAPR